MFKTKTEYLDYMEKKFIECFKEKGYIEEQPVNITSQLDPTVDFIGSKISPLKKYVLSDDIGYPGRFLIQNCMKLKSLDHLKDLTPQIFGSYYKCMGVLAEPNLEKVVHDTFDYLTNPEYLNIPFEDIHIRISSKDEDLVKSIENVDSRIEREFDTVSEKHYRHKYGMDEQGIFGRDFNIAIKNSATGKYFNCGTFVVMENAERIIAIDMGLGNCSLSMCKFGSNSTVESSRMGDIIVIDTVEKMKLADSIIAISTLLKEDILNHPSKHFRKKFRQYNQALHLWKNYFNISDEEIISYINKYLFMEYKVNNCISEESFCKVLKHN